MNWKIISKYIIKGFFFPKQRAENFRHPLTRQTEGSAFLRRSNPRQTSLQSLG